MSRFKIFSADKGLGFNRGDNYSLLISIGFMWLWFVEHIFFLESFEPYNLFFTSKDIFLEPNLGELDLDYLDPLLWLRLLCLWLCKLRAKLLYPSPLFYDKEW